MWPKKQDNNNTNTKTQTFFPYVCVMHASIYTCAHIPTYTCVLSTELKVHLFFSTVWKSTWMRWTVLIAQIRLMTHDDSNNAEMQKVRRHLFLPCTLNIKCLWLTVMKTQFYCYLNYSESIPAIRQRGEVGFGGESLPILSNCALCGG